MNTLSLVYTMGFVLAILMLFPITYGVWLDGLSKRVEHVFFYLLVVHIGWSVCQLLIVLVSDRQLLQVLFFFSTLCMYGSVYSYVVFTVVYTGYFPRIGAKKLLLGFLPFGIIGAYDLYRVAFISPSVMTSPFTRIMYEITIFDYLLIAYSVLLFSGIYVLLGWKYFTKPQTYQSIPFLFFGLIAPFLLGVVSYIEGITPVYLFNHAPLGFPIFAICITIALYQFELLTLRPVALERFVEEIPDPVFILNTEKTIIGRNNAAKEKFGELQNIPLEFVSFLSHQQLQKLFDKEDIIITQTNSGQETTYSISCSKVTNGGHHLGWVVYAKDITQIETQRKELERQNKHLEKFADGITHELRNPLFVASEYATLYFESVHPDSDTAISPTRAENTIKKSLNRMEEIIENVRWLSKYSQTVTETTTVNVKATATDVWDTIETNTCSLSVEEGLFIEANETRMKSVFENLFRNSVRYGGEETQITVTSGDDEVIYIRDDGPGMTQETKESLFEYGYTTSDDGTGFGLSLVQTIINAHGGEIHVEEGYTDGASFKITGLQVQTETSKKADS